jgi:hypothetical protein
LLSVFEVFESEELDDDESDFDDDESDFDDDESDFDDDESEDESDDEDELVSFSLAFFPVPRLSVL